MQKAHFKTAASGYDVYHSTRWLLKAKERPE
jgi:hypothetical protein